MHCIFILTDRLHLQAWKFYKFLQLIIMSFGLQSAPAHKKLFFHYVYDHYGLWNIASF